MSANARLFTPVLIGGSLILLINFALRASFGVFQIPIAEDFGWPRAEFSLAIAIQNLAWGIGQPIFGALAERWGDRWAIILGAFLYSAGLILTAFATTPAGVQLLEIMVGFGIAGTGFGVILAVVGRAASDENRSLALGIATAAGSAGQVFGAPLAEILLAFYAWQSVFIIFGVIILGTLAFLPMRTIAAAAFILTPITPATLIVFSLVMGALWLATVPLTSGLVAYIYGLRYMGTLYGFVFLSHQIGSFIGVWLGGWLYDVSGDYLLVWWIGVGVGAFSALIHLPVREAPLRMPAPAAA